MVNVVKVVKTVKVVIVVEEVVTDTEENTDKAMDASDLKAGCPAIGVDVWTTFDDHGRHVEIWKPWKDSSRCYMVVYTRVDAFSVHFPQLRSPRQNHKHSSFALYSE